MQDDDKPVEISEAMAAFLEPAQDAWERFEAEHPELLGKYIVLRTDTGEYEVFETEQAMRAAATKTIASLPPRKAGVGIGRVIWFQSGMKPSTHAGQVN